MNCVLVFLAVVLSLVQIHHAADQQECKKLFRPCTLKCCKDDSKLKFPDDLLKDCLKFLPPKGSMPPPDENNPNPPPCDFAKCFTATVGWTDEDGNFHKDILQATIDSIFADMPELKKNIEEKCVNGDLNQYAHEDACDAIKVKHCMHAQFVKACHSWDTEGKCADIKALVDDCKTMF